MLPRAFLLCHRLALCCSALPGSIHGGVLLWLQPNMLLYAFPQNLQARREMLFISMHNYLKSETQQKRAFNLASSRLWGPMRWIFCLVLGFSCWCVLEWLITYLALATKRATKSPPERDWGEYFGCRLCSWQGGFSTSLRFTLPSFALLILSSELV